MLKELTLYGEVDKVQLAINRLRLHEPKEGYYVAFSGGKDSCVVLDLCKRAGVKYDAHYALTTVDPPEVIYFIRRYHPDAWENRIRPETSMWNLIPKKRMPPTQRVRYCCKYFKERGGEGRFVVTGVRHQESAKRAKRRLVETCTGHSMKRWPKYVKLYKMAFQRMIDKRKADGLPCNTWQSSEDVFTWWVNRKKTEDGPDAISLFGLRLNESDT